ncbi:Aminotransferase class V [[Clostridium] ultunense Esp]|uniref:Tritium exchange subunit n=1 Tax=[Clostridium] ultunense Esp TaxID=1288971 RepID=M1Z694_9FIRM|nr:alanine--glyoxylate aminotransferase family protein [Schnuerera ultunensis]CCQ93103.1 Aminotransferase class V [[Clostridium] ultunense Esp]SHD77888.1 Aminotransferase class V [[Clostridium] ultunense Esp]
MQKKVQMMVGPTAIPHRVLKAMNKESISHRSKEYSIVQERVTEGLKKIFGTTQDVLLLTSSGTGAMESVIQNCFSPNDEVVIPVMGNFSEQFALIAEIYGLNVKRVKFELGEAANVDTVMKEVNPGTKAVFVVHNESSTGVFNDLEAFGRALKDTNTLLITDSVSGLGGLEVKMDEWNIDIVLTSSQKSLMAPPGLAFVALSENAWGSVENSKFPKYYFDYKKAKKFNEINQTLTTPAVYTLFAVDEAVKMIMEEGLDNVYSRHRANSKLVIKGIKEAGLKLFAKDERFASPTLTAVYAPRKAKYIVNELAKKSIVVNGGLAPMDEDIFRVGTMGYVSENDVIAFLSAINQIKI